MSIFIDTGVFVAFHTTKNVNHDCTSVALMNQNKIENIASFDTDFDGIKPRIS